MPANISSASPVIASTTSYENESICFSVGLLSNGVTVIVIDTPLFSNIFVIPSEVLRRLDPDTYRSCRHRKRRILAR